MAENAKNAILARIAEEGHTDSYGMLLYLTAFMGLDPMMLDPVSRAEVVQWSGHFDGLRASLLWLAMHERHLGPELAADVVERQISEAVKDLEPKTTPKAWCEQNALLVQEL